MCLEITPNVPNFSMQLYTLEEHATKGTAANIEELVLPLLRYLYVSQYQVTLAIKKFMVTGSNDGISLAPVFHEGLYPVLSQAVPGWYLVWAPLIPQEVKIKDPSDGETTTVLTIPLGMHTRAFSSNWDDVVNAVDRSRQISPGKSAELLVIVPQDAIQLSGDYHDIVVSLMYVYLGDAKVQTTSKQGDLKHYHMSFGANGTVRLDELMTHITASELLAAANAIYSAREPQKNEEQMALFMEDIRRLIEARNHGTESTPPRFVWKDLPFSVHALKS